MNEVAQRPVIDAKTAGPVKVRSLPAAHAAQSGLVQGVLVLKRNSTAGALGRGPQRLQALQASVADRRPRETHERRTANTAIVGEEERKDGVKEVGPERTKL